MGLKQLLFVSTMLLAGFVAQGQTIIGFPTLSQLDSTTYQIELQTDSAAVISIHAAEDSTYRNTFVFLGRTVGLNNKATITLDKLRKNADYMYRIFIGTRLSPISGTFSTKMASKK